MSETEIGNIAMVPPEKIVPTQIGLAGYKRVFTFIDVVALPEGARILRVHGGKEAFDFRLDAECAAHLATLLGHPSEAA